MRLAARSSGVVDHTIFEKLTCATMRTTETIHMNDIGQLTALTFLQTNDLEKVVPSAGFLADQ
eukprot:2657443-Prymnesium_polylepis.1